MVTSEDLDETSHLPREGGIRCTEIRAWTDETGRALIRVSTQEPDHVESGDGRTEFDLLPSQVWA